MSDGTVQRYELVGDGEYWSMRAMDEGDYMLYADHKAIVDALRTQAREMAGALLHQIKDKNCTPYINRLVELSQAVLKEGA